MKPVFGLQPGPQAQDVLQDSVAAMATGDSAASMPPAGAGLEESLWSLDAMFEQLLDLVVVYLPRLASALVLLIILYVLYRVSYHVVRRILQRSKRFEPGIVSLSLKAFRIGAWVLIGISVADQMGIDITALLAGLSIAGIALGFAARDTLENFIAGITILADGPFRIGDQIEVDGTFGIVDDITLRSTRLRTPNDTIMVMPNLLMINQKLLNHTMRESLRVEIPFGIAYKEFPDEARRVVLALCEGDERLDPAIPPSVVVSEMGSSSVDMVLRFHIRNPKQELPIRHEYVEKVREALRTADIEIPFPHLQLFIDGAKGLEARTPPSDA